MSPWARAIAASVPLALAFAPEALAGNLQAVQQGTTLKVTGDDFGADLNLIGLPGQPNSVRVGVVNPTTVNGGMADIDFFGVESIKVTLGDDSNHLDLVDLDLDGGVSIKGGAGNDTILLALSAIGGGLSVTGGLGELIFRCDRAEVDGKLSVKGGPGDDFAFVASCGLHGSVQIALGSGSNELLAVTNDFARSVAISSGDGSDFSTFLGGAVGEKLSLRLGDGFNTFSADDFGAGRLSYKGGSDQDTVSFGAIEVEETASIQLGNGQNRLRLEQGSEIGESLRVSGGRGDDELTISDTSIGEDAKLGLGHGNNGVALQDAQTGDDLTVTAGSGDDEVIFSGTVEVDGTTKFQLDGGTNTTPP